MHDLREFGSGKHKQVDDYAFGGGAGMVIKAEPLFECIEGLLAERDYDAAKQLEKIRNLVAVCGRCSALITTYRDDGRYRVRIEAPWPGWPSGDPVEDAARYMRELEAVVRECPEQYLWAHRRFKSRPEGAPRLYDKKQR